ncbi:MAG: hypothetical protein ABII64_08285 [Elusimicrobiota bacterium]
MKIQVCNLSKFVTEEILKEHFGKFGTVSSATVVMDKATGQSKRFGFVEMPDQAEGKAAIKALHHTQILKVPVRVKMAGTMKTEDGRWKTERLNNNDWTSRRPKPPGQSRTGFATSGLGPPRERNRAGMTNRYVGKPIAPLPISPRPAVAQRPVYQGKAVNTTYDRREKPEFKPGFRKQHGPNATGNRKTEEGRWKTERPTTNPPLSPPPRRIIDFSKGGRKEDFKARDRFIRRDERPYRQHSPSVRSKHPFGSFLKQDSSRPSFAPRNARSMKTEEGRWKTERPTTNPPLSPFSKGGRKEDFKARDRFIRRDERPYRQHSPSVRSKHPFGSFRNANKHRPEK